MNRNNIRLLTERRRLSEAKAVKRRETVGGRAPEDAYQLKLTPPSGYASSLLVLLITVFAGISAAVFIILVK